MGDLTIFSAITKAAQKNPRALQSLSPVDNGRGWLSWWAGRPETDFQRDIKIEHDCVLAYSAVFACITLIQSDVAKMCFKLLQKAPSGIWTETTSPAFSPVLAKPNPYQNHIQFKEQWMISKLSRGNTYVLKQRDNRNVVTALYILDPCRVTPLVATDGSIFYQLGEDNLTGLQEGMITVPASEIIHDRMNCLFHPLVGISPIFACGLAAMQGINIQRSSSLFFENGSQPSGILTAPGSISDDTAKRLKDTWSTNYGGKNRHKVAVVGDNLTYTPMAMSAIDAQLIDQLKWSAETVCSCFHVPAYKIGVGTMPAYNNIEALDQQYYSQCLQSPIESMELCLDEGLATPANYSIELDLDGLLRMDTSTQVTAMKEAIAGGFLSPNEARRKFGYAPVTGGDTPYLQQQNFALSDLAKRSELANPFIVDKPATNPTPSDAGPAATADPAEEAAKAFADLMNKGLELLNAKPAEGLINV